MSDFSDDVGVDAVEHTRKHSFRGLPNNSEYSDSDQKTNYWVCERIAEPYARSANHHSKASEAIRTGMVAISDECRTVDLAADPNTKYCHGFIADEANYASERDPSQQLNCLRINKAIDRYVSRHQSAE